MRFPPAWYPDPTARHDHRWWDGEEWTAHVADGGVATIDPLPPTPGPDLSTAPAAPAGTAPGIAVAALVVGLAAAILGWVPFVGVAVAGGALALSLGARRRVGRGPGRGMAIVGSISAGVGLVAASATSLVAVVLLADGTAGRLGEAARDYVECLEVEAPETCERRLTDDLLDLLGG